MRYLLDTNVISEIMRPAPEPKVLAWMGATPHHDVAISVVSIGELERGLLKVAGTRRGDELRALVQQVLSKNFPLLDVDQPTMLRWAALTVQADQQGRPPATLDTLLAATAMRHGLTLATRNTRHFEAFGVPLVNPWL